MLDKIELKNRNERKLDQSMLAIFPRNSNFPATDFCKWKSRSTCLVQTVGKCWQILLKEPAVK